MKSPDLIPFGCNWPISTPELITVAGVGLYIIVVLLYMLIRAHHLPTRGWAQTQANTWAEDMEYFLKGNSG